MLTWNNATSKWIASSASAGNIYSSPVVLSGQVPVLWYDGSTLSAAAGTTLYNLISATPLGQNAMANSTAVTVGATLNAKNTYASAGGANQGFLISKPVVLTQCTVFAVLKIASVLGGSNEAPLIAGPSACLEYRIDPSGIPGLNQNYTASIGSSTAGALTSGTWYQMNATYNSVSGAYAFRQGRAAAGSGTNVKSISAANSSVGWNPAGTGGGTNNSFNGNIAELIVYDQVLTSTQITAIENYLNTKWGV